MNPPWTVHEPTAHSLQVNAYHPLHTSSKLRAPTPTIHVFLDSEELFVEGSGDLDQILAGL